MLVGWAWLCRPSKRVARHDAMRGRKKRQECQALRQSPGPKCTGYRHSLVQSSLSLVYLK
jgi:hypothetical protein